MKYFFTLTFILLIAGLNAQDTTKWATPQVTNMPIGRGFDINYSRVFNTSLEAESEATELADGRAELTHLNNVEVDLKIPIYITARTQVVGSGEYTYDRLIFNNLKSNNYELFEILHDKALRSRKLKFYLVHSFNSENFLKVRTSLELNGDVSDSKQSITEFAKHSLSATYGWKKSKNNAYAVGLYMDYALGRPSIYPVFEWNKTWNKTWGFESKLPAQFKLRYTPNNGTRIYAGYAVGGISYRLVAPNSDSDMLVEFEARRSDLKFSINLEKRLIDFVWLAVESGLNYNIRFEVADNDKLYDNETIIDGQFDPAPFCKFSLFIVPNNSLKRIFGYE